MLDRNQAIVEAPHLPPVLTFARVQAIVKDPKRCWRYLPLGRSSNEHISALLESIAIQLPEPRLHTFQVEQTGDPIINLLRHPKAASQRRTTDFLGDLGGHLYKLAGDIVDFDAEQSDEQC